MILEINDEDIRTLKAADAHLADNRMLPLARKIRAIYERIENLEGD